MLTPLDGTSYLIHWELCWIKAVSRAKIQWKWPEGWDPPEGSSQQLCAINTAAIDRARKPERQSWGISSVRLHKTRLLDMHYLAVNKPMGSQRICFPIPGKRIYLAVCLQHWEEVANLILRVPDSGIPFRGHRRGKQLFTQPLIPNTGLSSTHMLLLSTHFKIKKKK